MTLTEFGISCLCAYLVGTVPWSWILVRWKKGVDLRTLGSGNLGATNAGRVLGFRWAAVVYALDLVKGSSAVVVPPLVFGGADAPGMPYPVIGGLLAVLGHVFPFYMGFKGGKGVATGSGVIFALEPLTGAVAVVVWGLSLALGRMVSVASIVAALSLPVTYAVAGRDQPDFAVKLGFFAVVATLVTVMHRSNIKRVLAGTERKIGQSG